MTQAESRLTVRVEGFLEPDTDWRLAGGCVWLVLTYRRSQRNLPAELILTLRFNEAANAKS